MASVEIKVEVDSKDCSAHMDEWKKLAKHEATEASRDGAHEIKRVYSSLMDRFHPWDTKTPASPGSPAASVSGVMKESVIVMPDGDGYMAGPTAVQARIQELGGDMFGNPEMHFFWEGRWHHRTEVRLPGRPVLKPALREAKDTGELGRIFRRHWERAQRMAM